MKINSDIIWLICEFMDDKSKVNFTSVSNSFIPFKNKIFYDDMISYNKIEKLYYFNRFRNVYVETMVKFPKFITNLTFGYFFDQDIKGAIPNSVTHLTFGDCFNQDIKEAIPGLVTHLTFGWNFNQDIKGAIPWSVTHLNMSDKFYKKNIDDVPKHICVKTY